MDEKIKKETLAFKALKKGNYLEAENILREIVSSGTNNYSPPTFCKESKILRKRNEINI